MSTLIWSIEANIYSPVHLSLVLGTVLHQAPAALSTRLTEGFISVDTDDPPHTPELITHTSADRRHSQSRHTRSSCDLLYYWPHYDVLWGEMGNMVIQSCGYGSFSHWHLQPWSRWCVKWTSHSQSVPGLIWHMHVFSSSLSKLEACLFAKTGCV